MIVIETAAEMRAWTLEQRFAGKSIGFVPTMGALHEGHVSLMRASAAENGATAISIFVNPTQFGPREDFARYPRTLAKDSQMAQEAGVDAIYLPSAQAMYPEGYETYVVVGRVTERLCGHSRPHFFRGVTTVVTKLFNAVQPDRAYFGQKDAQQCAVIKRMTRDLDWGIEIVEMPIVREPDGLAMSSRNAYLSPSERQDALCISRALFEAQAMLEAGERDQSRIILRVRERLADVIVAYAEIVDAEDIQPVDDLRGPIVLAIAAVVGETRLIDNIKFDPRGRG